MVAEEEITATAILEMVAQAGATISVVGDKQSRPYLKVTPDTACFGDLRRALVENRQMMIAHLLDAERFNHQTAEAPHLEGPICMPASQAAALSLLRDGVPRGRIYMRQELKVLTEAQRANGDTVGLQIAKEIFNGKLRSEL